MAASGSQATPTSTTIRSTKKGAKGGKKGQKRCLHHFATTASYGDAGEEIKDSDVEFVATVGRDFQRSTRPPKGHFKKILEAACPHHPYPVRNKLRDYTMMKRFITLGAPPGGDEPTRDSRGRGTVLAPEVVEVATITG
jgi:hypothetical protein